MNYPWLESQWTAFRNQLDRRRVAHAILLQGPEGAGKNELAKEMAGRLLCLADGDRACGDCRSCNLLRGGAHPDWFIAEPEEGKHQIVIDQVR